MRPRHRTEIGERSEDGVIHPDGDNGHAVGVHAHLLCDVVTRVLRNGHDGRESPCDPDLHAEEPEPAAGGDALPGSTGMRQGQLAVHRDGVVQRREQRPPVGDYSQHARSEALVVVHHVEVAAPGGQEPADAAREGQWLAEAGRAHDAELQPVLEGPHLARMRDPERIGLPVQVESGDRCEAHPVVELGPGGTREDLDRMAEPYQLAGEVAGVHTLAAAARIPPIDEERHAKSPRSGVRGRHPGRKLQLERALPRLLRLGPHLVGGPRHTTSRQCPPCLHSLSEPPGPAQATLSPGRTTPIR